MELPNKVEYALLAMFVLAVHFEEDEPIQLRQIAVEQNIPNRYLDQLLAELKRSELIHSERGVKGGYRLANQPQKITVLDIINCIEGDAQPIPDEQATYITHERAAIFKVWQEARQAAQTIWQGYTLQDLLDKRELRLHLNVMYYI